MITMADLLRCALIFGIWGAIAFLLWQVAWFWAVIWIVPGLYVVMNVVGFATLPIYHLVGRSDPRMREAQRMLDEIERRDSA